MVGPLVSLITVAYNSEKTIAKTIESVLNQSYSNIEYTILDGKSEDKTVEVAESYKELFKERNIKYTIISEEDNGMYDAINKGVSLSKGVIIGNINSDDWYEPDAVLKVVQKYDETGFDMVYGDLRVVKSTGNIIKKAKLKKFVSTRYWNHPTTFITAKTYKKFKYKMESMYDDCDLMLRIRKSNLKVVVINEVLANFRFGGMSTKKDIRDTIERIKLRSKIYFNNGYYNPLYYIDGAVVESAKFILS